MGPAKQPPCLIHLHSPSELIFRHNQWDVTLSDYAPLRQCERYCIQNADALLSPSRYLAREAEELFGLAAGQVLVIPYPLGDSCGIERPAAVWRRDSVCFTGRLELRKGVVEWVDAAVKVAQTHPTVSFDFIGSDTSLDGGPGASVRRFLWDRIPAGLRPRFHFHGSMSREKLRKALAGTPIAVVPSRWENLPYSCIEAMSSGLPVLVSPHGGMRELIGHGESGWIAADATAAALAAALRTALETPPARRAKMGQNAAAAVSRHCSNQTVVKRHLELRRRLTEPMTDRPAAMAGIPTEDRRGMAVVVTCGDRVGLLPQCLEHLARQTESAARVVVIGSSKALEWCRASGAGFVDEQTPSSREAALQQVFDAAPHVAGVVLVDAGVQLEPHCLAAFAAVLQRRPDAGMVAGFSRYAGQTADLNVTPNFDLQSLEATGECFCLAVRTEALQDRHTAGTGWATVTYPEVLVLAPARKPSGGAAKKRYSAMALAQRTSSKLMWTWFLGAPVAEKVRWVGRALFQPRRAAQWVSWQVRTASTRTR
jgi:hypothetical protein